MRTLSLIMLATSFAGCSDSPSTSVDSAPPVDATPGDARDIDAAPDAQPPDASGVTTWTKTFGSSAFESAEAVAVLANGDLVVAGYTNGTLNLGGGALGQGGEQRTTWIARFTSAGAHVWSHSFVVANNLGDASPPVVLAIGPDDSIYLATSSSAASTDAGTGALAKIGARDLVLVKYGPDGTVSHATRRGGTNAKVVPSGIAVDGTSVVATGTLDTTDTNTPSTTVDLGTGAITGAGATDAWAAGFDSALATTWAAKLGAPTYPDANSGGGIAIDPVTHRATMCGIFRSGVDFGGGVRTPNGGAGHYDIYVLTLAVSDGAYVSDLTVGGTSDEVCRALALDGAGGLYLAGAFSGTTSIGGASATAAGFEDGFLAHLSGATASYLDAVGSANHNTEALAVTQSGVTAGQFADTVQLGGMSLTSASYSGFVARIGATGAATWVTKFGESGQGTVRGLAESPAGVFAVGSFEGSVLVDGTPVASGGSSDLFIARLAP